MRWRDIAIAARRKLADEMNIALISEQVTNLVDMSLMGATSSFCSFILGWSLKTISTSEAAPDPPAPEVSASESVIGIGFSFFFFFGGGACMPGCKNVTLSSTT